MPNLNGNTSDDFVQIYNEGLTTGLVRAAAVKNVHASRSLDVRFRQEDCFGGPEQAASYTVLPGMSKSFTTFDGGLGLSGPASAFAIDVKSTVAMMAASYEAVITQGD